MVFIEIDAFIGTLSLLLLMSPTCAVTFFFSIQFLYYFNI